MTKDKSTAIAPTDHIARSILILRGQRVLLDSDLAALYGVETRRLNEQVRRNYDRFPVDFIFELTSKEFTNLKSQSATSSWGRPTQATARLHGTRRHHDRDRPQQLARRKNDDLRRARLRAATRSTQLQPPAR